MLNSNHTLTHLVGLCPLLAITNSTGNALGLGISTMIIILLSSICLAVTIPYIPHHTRLPVNMLIISGLTSLLLIAIQSLSIELYDNIGLFLQIIITNCAILHYLSTISQKQTLYFTIDSSWKIAKDFLIVLLLLGLIREVIGTGSIFNDLEFLNITPYQILPQYHMPLLFILPPGAFFGFAFLVAYFQYKKITPPSKASIPIKTV